MNRMLLLSSAALLTLGVATTASAMGGSGSASAGGPAWLVTPAVATDVYVNYDADVYGPPAAGYYPANPPLGERVYYHTYGATHPTGNAVGHELDYAPDDAMGNTSVMVIDQ